MQRLFKKYTESKFVRNILHLMSANLLINLLTLISIPILTRYYLPEDFGTLQAIISVTIVLNVLVSLSMESSLALNLSDNCVHQIETDAKNLIHISILNLIIISVFLKFISIENSFFEIVNKYFLIIIAVLFFSAINRILQKVLLLKSMISTLAKLRVLRVLVSQFGAIILWFVWKTSFGVTYSYTLSFILISLLLLYKCNVNDLFNFSLKDIYGLLKKRWKFPLINAPSSFINNISNELPVYMLTLYYNTEIVGYYMMANKIFRMPFGLLTRPLSESYLQRAAVKKNESVKSLKKFFLSTIGHGFFIIIITLLIVFLCSDLVIKVMLGPEWTDVGLIMKILSIWITMELLYNPISNTFMIMDRNEYLLFLNIALPTVRFICMYTFRSNYINMLYGLSISSGIMYIFYILMAYSVIVRSE